MDVFLEAVKSGNLVQAVILPATWSDMPLKKDDWNFNWRQLFKTEEAQFYKVALKEPSSRIEGIMMLSVVNGEMLYLNNVEVSPANYGTEGKLDHVAGCLIAYACRQSFHQGKNNYNGYLSFESKTVLIELYQKKYGATLAMGQKMYFDPDAGRRLMQQYLGFNY